MTQIRLIQRNNGRESKVAYAQSPTEEGRNSARVDYSGRNSLVMCPDGTVYHSFVTFRDFDKRYQRR